MAVLIAPVILRKKIQSEKQITLPAEIKKDVSSVTTTTTTTTKTQQKTTTKAVTTKATTTVSEIHSEKESTETTTKQVITATAQPTQKSVVDNLTTTEQEQATTSKSTTTVAEFTTVAKSTTTTPPVTPTSANFEPVEIEWYYPTEEEWNMFCVVVCSETGYCEDKVQLAIAHTVINRLSNPKFPDTIKEILNQQGQYTCIQNYYTGYMRPGLEIGGAAYNHTMQVVHQAWEEWDFTNGAVAYYNPHMIGWNAWFEQFECVYEDKYGRFFKI